MIKKVLVANRGEIASRIIRACREMGIATVAIYSEADTTSLYVKKADESYMIGPGPVEGYLNIHRIVDLALKVGVDAIHPGYGFLAENPKLPELCEKKGITFIGPTSQAMRDMGNKVKARGIMKSAGIPVVPGSEGSVEDIDAAISIAEDIGYPVMIKASAGGGGRGLRIARNRKELMSSFTTAQSEAKLAFGDSEVFIEKCIESPHHIEFQVLADKYGKVIHLGERDCSIQRRHQKIVEIAPSLFLDEDKRRLMGELSIKGARAVNYVNAGTMEYLVDKDKNFYFIEMNTRIQVEHTITEEVTGIDLVRKQIEIAMGKRLDIDQGDVTLRGYAIECRINAEDPKNNFTPNAGRVTAYYSPGGIGVRIDGAIYKDYLIPPYYDSLLAKLVVRGMSWDEAVSRAERSLGEFVIRGVKTNIPFLLKIVKSPDFRCGNFNTQFIDKNPHFFEYDEFKEPQDLVAAISSAIAAYHGF